VRIDMRTAGVPLAATRAAAGTTTPTTAGLRVARRLVDAFVSPAPAPAPPGGVEDAGPDGDDGAGPADGAPSGRRARRRRRSAGAGVARSGAGGDPDPGPPTSDPPDDDDGPVAGVPAPAGDAVAVLCRGHDALAVGGAVAAARARRHALLVLWGAEGLPAVCAPALPAATRLAATLRERGHAAVATGRLAVVVAPGLADVRRIAAVAGPAPVVVALAGPRDAAVDALLREQDAVLVAGADGAVLTELALEDLALTGIPARAVAVPVGARRVLAASGLRAT
jgi:hypothetical protein